MKVGGRFRKWETKECIEAASVYASVIGQGGDRKDGTRAVAAAIDRSYDGVSYRLTYYGPTFSDPDHNPGAALVMERRRSHRRKSDSVRGPISYAEPPDEVVDERNFRHNLKPVSLTAAICGDPKPGYSALDRK
jgi:hypothetical protein